jgi:predicted RNase H-like nuclease
VIFIGVDAAWGDANETGLVALESSGHIRDAGWTTGVASAAAWICDHAQPDMLVFIDAPLIVTNPTGQRLCETHVGQRYWRWSVSANSTNTASRRLGGVALLAMLQNNRFRYDDGIDGLPRCGRVVSECYPYTTIVGYEPFGYDMRPLYKRKPRAMRTAEFRAVRAGACDELIRRIATLAHADPPLDLGSHKTTRKLLEEPSPLENTSYKHREDLLDAALCAWTSSLWHRHGFDRCQVLGAVPGVGRPAATIIAPARPEQRIAE